MISHKKVAECAKTIVQYCKEQRGCQNCIFRMHGGEHWNCHIYALQIGEVIANIEAKRKNGGYL